MASWNPDLAVGQSVCERNRLTIKIELDEAIADFVSATKRRNKKYIWINKQRKKRKTDGE